MKNTTHPEAREWEGLWKTAHIRHFSQNTGEFPEIDGIVWVASEDVQSFISSLISRIRSEERVALREAVEGMMYVFERPKDDYLPEVFRHLTSKNEARTEVLSLLSTPDKVFIKDPNPKEI